MLSIFNVEQKLSRFSHRAHHIEPNSITRSFNSHFITSHQNFRLKCTEIWHGKFHLSSIFCRGWKILSLIALLLFLFEFWVSVIWYISTCLQFTRLSKWMTFKWHPHTNIYPSRHLPGLLNTFFFCNKKIHHCTNSA